MSVSTLRARIVRKKFSVLTLTHNGADLAVWYELSVCDRIGETFRYNNRIRLYRIEYCTQESFRIARPYCTQEAFRGSDQEANYWSGLSLEELD